MRGLGRRGRTQIAPDSFFQKNELSFGFETGNQHPQGRDPVQIVLPWTIVLVLEVPADKPSCNSQTLSLTWPRGTSKVSRRSKHPKRTPAQYLTRKTDVPKYLALSGLLPGVEWLLRQLPDAVNSGNRAADPLCKPPH